VAWVPSRGVEGLFAPWHLLIVFVVALLVFGPSKLPEMGRQIGRGMAEFRKFRDSFDNDLRGFLGHDEHHENEEPSSKPSGGELPPADTGGKLPPADTGGKLPPADTGGRPPLPEGRD
jgi:TatA/E family protein of Tat protein translocase